MDPRSPTARQQRRRLEQLRALGVCTDESLSAYLREVGEPCDRTTLVRYRAGDRTAPLGLLDLVLGHVNDPAAVLELWARDYGLRVVPEVDPPTDSRPLSARSMEVAAMLGDLLRAVQMGKLDDVASISAEMRRVAGELEVQARREAA